MRYFLWIVKFALFALALTFAVKNTDPVVVRYFLGQEWHAPLIFVMLVFFCLGVGLGLTAALVQIMRQRREISSLKRALDVRSPAVVPAPQPPDVAPGL